jgi:non-ribosomal peptide synthetase component F
MACYATHSVSATVSSELRDRLARLAEATSSTMMMVLMSGFAATLHGITKQPTLCFQTTLSQRHDRQLERVVGPVANPVIIRIDAVAPSFDVLAKRTRDAVVAAFEHSKSPVISWASHRIRRINFNFNPRTFGANAGSTEITPGLVARDFVVPLEHAKTPFDVHLWLFERADGIGLRMLGNSEVFELETCEMLLRRFVEMLDEVA